MAGRKPHPSNSTGSSVPGVLRARAREPGAASAHSVSASSVQPARKEAAGRAAYRAEIQAKRPHFKPTGEWQEVMAGCVCPAGLEYRMCMKTGRNFARAPPASEQRRRLRPSYSEVASKRASALCSLQAGAHAKGGMGKRAHSPQPAASVKSPRRSPQVEPAHGNGPRPAGAKGMRVQSARSTKPKGKAAGVQPARGRKLPAPAHAHAPAPGMLAGRRGAKEKCPDPGAGVCRRAGADFVAWQDERGLDGEAELRAMAAGRITPARRQAMLAAGVSSESDGEDEDGGYEEGGYYEDEGGY